jgi:hypothetical protein
MSEYNATIQTIKDTLGHVLNEGEGALAHCQINIECIDEMMTHMESGRIDFPDLLVSRVCEENDLILVTDDGDFAWFGGVLCSANKKLL